MHLATLLLVGLVVASPGPVVTRSRVLATVNGLAITEADTRDEPTAQRSRGGNDRRAVPARRPEALERAIDRTLVLSECRRRRLWPSESDVRSQWRGSDHRDLSGPTSLQVRERRCLDALLHETMDTPVTESDLRSRWLATARSVFVVPDAYSRRRHPADLTTVDAAPSWVVGRIWQIPIGASAPEAEVALRKAVQSRAEPEASGMVRRREVTSDEMDWREHLERMKPGEIRSPQRDGDTLFALERTGDRFREAIHEVDFQERRGQLRASVLMERRIRARLDLLARLRRDARITRASAALR